MQELCGLVFPDLKATGGQAEVIELTLDILGPGNFIATTLEDESVAAIKARFPEVPAALSLGRSLKTVPSSRWAQIRLSGLFPLRRIRTCGADWATVNWQLAAGRGAGPVSPPAAFRPWSGR